MGAAFQPTAELLTIPSSFGGVNVVDSFASMPPQDCIYTYNMMPSEYGMRLRMGYREWANGVGSEVRTLLPFEGSKRDNTTNRLFVVGEDGIYNCTTFGETAPTQEVLFGTVDSFSGFGTKAQFTSDASVHYMFYADETNGLYRYDEVSGVWAAAAGITGVSAADIAFVNVHKQRVWLVEADSSDAWYLPVDSISGAATKFTFGAKFKHGGQLMGVWSWTIDGGDGVDDYLIGVSRAGDVLAYRGSDPSQPDWELVGSYYIGEVPLSRNLALEFGPDLYLLSTSGITSVRDLLQGASLFDESRSPTAKIAKLLETEMVTKKESPIWSMATNPSDNFLQIIAPKGENTPYVQYNQHTTTKAWGMWRGVPILSASAWQGSYFFGTVDGNVFEYSGTRDGTLLPVGEEDPVIGDPIEYSLLTAFNPLGNPALHSQVNMTRVVGISGTAEKSTMKILWDYDVVPKAPSPGLPDPNLGALWDVSIWDVDVWDSPIRGTSRIIGGQGMGRLAAVALRGRATARVYLVQFDISFRQGGFL